MDVVTEVKVNDGVSIRLAILDVIVTSVDAGRLSVTLCVGLINAIAIGIMIEVRNPRSIDYILQACTLI